MVYTSAYDVLSLAASPLTLIQSIYQVICANGTTVNVIDLAPRVQALFPVQLQKMGLASTLRAKVLISGRARSDTRVGLTFRGAQLKPTLLPFNIDVSRLPSFGVKFPRAPEALRRRIGSDSVELQDPGFFDVLYLDEDCQIIRQNEIDGVSGVFVSVRSSEPIYSFLKC
jgi:hypothetical protein